MDYFFDSSALAKLYHPELGTDVVRVIFDSGSRIFASSLAILELTSVAAIKVRTGVIDEGTASAIVHQLSVQVTAGRFLLQRLDDKVLELAAALLVRHAKKHSLRTLDAIHLASALRRTELTGVLHFVTSDRTLAQVAQLEEVAVLNPEDSPKS